MHALIVDDSTTIRKILTAYLQKLGFDVTAAVNGRDGLDQLRAMKKADVVLVDWNMPEMDGITCLRALRAMDLNPRPVVVMCTTENGMSKIREALEAGADEYIMKPYDQGVLLDKLTQVGLVEQA